MTVFVFFLLMVKHFICDFALQGRLKQTHDKHKLTSVKGHLHALDHASGTAFVFLLVSIFMFIKNDTSIFVSVLLFAVLDYIAHFKIDWLKNNFVVANDFKHSDRAFWILTSIDQILHTLTYLVFVIVFDIYFF